MKRGAGSEEHEAVVAIPLVLRVGPIAVEITLAVGVALHAEDVRIAVRVQNLYKVLPMQTASRVLKRFVSLRHL